MRRNADAKAGDALILTKPLGVGIYSAAIKKDALPHGGYAEMIATTTLLNRVGAELAKDTDVHAITDVTGFGLLGHGLEMARGSGLALEISLGAVPLLRMPRRWRSRAASPARRTATGRATATASMLPDGLPDWQRHLLTDPQTSGGLLIACAPERADAIVRTIVAAVIRTRAASAAPRPAPPRSRSSRD